MKAFIEVWIDENLLYMITAIYDKPLVGITLSDERLKTSLLWLLTKQEWLLLLRQFNKVLEVSARAIRQEKEIKLFKLERRK